MRIAHFTDIHVTVTPSWLPGRHLLSKRALGWINLRFLGRCRHFADTGVVLAAFLEDLERVAPDHVVCTGDLTGMSLPEEFRAARAALEPLLARPDVTGIPGNHDVYVRAAVRDRLHEQAFGAWTRTDLAPEDLPEGFRDLHPYPLVRLLDGSTALIALLDVAPTALHDSSGRVGPRQLEALGRLLEDSRVARRRKILALHTGILRADGRPDRRLHGLRDAPGLLRTAEAGGVELIVHGHLHARAVLPAGGGSPVPLATPGSLTASHGERAYHVYHLLPGAIRVEVRRYDGGTGAFREHPELGTTLEAPAPKSCCNPASGELS